MNLRNSFVFMFCHGLSEGEIVRFEIFKIKCLASNFMYVEKLSTKTCLA